MAKVLISSLGTGSANNDVYQKTKYKIDNSIYETSFVADATIKHYRIDKVFFVGTNKSIWDEAYTAFGGDNMDYHEMLYLNKEDAAITYDKLEVLNKSISKYLVEEGSRFEWDFQPIHSIIPLSLNSGIGFIPNSV